MGERAMKRLIILSSIVLLASLSAAVADPVAAFSNLCVHSETGDVLGRRLVVMRFGHETYVVFQQGEGGLLDPEFTRADLNAKTGALSFGLKEPSPLKIKGKLTNTAFTYIDSGSKTVLPRVTSEDGAMTACK